ncbi:aminopeptidase N [Nocardioides insulae]|uniref:aminopeptidase N n=1 Tax=Nocardioides insulae TaxID=394734 RepID=UPI00040C1E8D|nr:aminopeptidase N [Nocardioides insulae]
MPSTYPSLLRAEAAARAALLDVLDYDVHLDLAADEATFESHTTIRFRSAGGSSFLDLKAPTVHSLRLDGTELGAEALDRGRVAFTAGPGEHEFVVRATMEFRRDGEGLHRSLDPADDRPYVYAMSFMDAAPSIFACFDQPDLKAPFTLHVRAPEGWSVVGNAPLAATERGADGSTEWHFERSRPLSTYFVTLVAGPYHLIREEHDGIPLSLSARASLAGDLEADAEELFTLTRQCFDEFHRLFGIRYPFGDYHQAFVPEFNASAMENPGCVTFRDPLIFSSKVTRGQRIQRATTIAHEMAHQWFGNLVTPQWWDDLWLNESFAEYMGNRVTADVTEYADTWVHNAYARRQWGLVADQRPSTHPVAGNGASDASGALQDFDGISYAKGSSILKQLNARLGDEVFFRGVIAHFETHRFGNATMHDLFGSWEFAGAPDLAAFTAPWLRTAGADSIRLDRPAGLLRCEPPGAQSADREHVIRIARAEPGGSWRTERVLVTGEGIPLDAGMDAVLPDPFEDTFAVAEPDEVTVAALPDLFPRTDDALLRAGIWNHLRSAYRHARLAPAAVIGLLEAGIGVEDSDDALFYTLPWVLGAVVPLAPAGARDRVHAAVLAKTEGSAPGSTLQLAAFQAAVDSCSDPAVLRGWLASAPAGVEVDLDLRWRILVRLSVLGEVDRTELRAAHEAEPTNRSRIELTRALSSLPDGEAKAYAWARFTGEVEVSNYELQAAGLGMWRHGQEHLTQEYAGRYFQELPGTVAVRSGWVLADAAADYFPTAADDQQTLGRVRTLLENDALAPPLHRRLVDAADDTRVRQAIREAYPAANATIGA